MSVASARSGVSLAKVAGSRSLSELSSPVYLYSVPTLGVIPSCLSVHITDSKSYPLLSIREREDEREREGEGGREEMKE